MLSSKNIEFDYFDIREDEEANKNFQEIKRILKEERDYKGALGVPTYVIGDEILVGTDEEKIDAAIAKFNIQ